MLRVTTILHHISVMLPCDYLFLVSGKRPIIIRGKKANPFVEIIKTIPYYSVFTQTFFFSHFLTHSIHSSLTYPDWFFSFSLMSSQDSSSDTIGCGVIYERFSKCMSPGYQLQNIYQYSSVKDCTGLFRDWKTCLYATASTDPVKKEVRKWVSVVILKNFILYVCRNVGVIEVYGSVQSVKG